MFINQTVGTLFLELAKDVADYFGPSYLICGTPTRDVEGNLLVRIGQAYNRQSPVSRLISWLAFLRFVLKQIRSTKPNLLLIITTNPPMLPALAWLMNCFRRQPYILLVYDIYPEILIGLGRLSPTNPLVWVWQKINRITFSRAQEVITLGKHMANNVRRYLPSKKALQLHIIPTWVDTERFVPIKKANNPFVHQYRLHDKLTVIYSGNLGFSHDIQIIIEAANCLVDIPDFNFLIIGDGPAKANLLNRSSRLGLNNIIFLPFQDEKVLPYSLASGDIAIISIGRGAEGMMMPSKTYYSMAVGSALIGLSDPPNDLSDVIDNYQCGVNVTQRDFTNLINVLMRFYFDRNYLLRCQTNARRAAEENFSRHSNTLLFTKLIESCLKPSYD